MFSLRKPTKESIDAFLASQSKLDFSYSAVGATATTPPADFQLDHTRVQLGAGRQVYDLAKAALRDWKQLKLGWVDVWPTSEPLQIGSVVGMAGRSLGIWWLNACRITYMIDDSTPTTRYGFAYGTLPGHLALGEERFFVEWNPADDSVWFDILAFSRPRHLLARAGYFWVRRLQKRFGRDSTAAMKRAVAQ